MPGNLVWTRSSLTTLANTANTTGVAFKICSVPWGTRCVASVNIWGRWQTLVYRNIIIKIYQIMWNDIWDPCLKASWDILRSDILGCSSTSMVFSRTPVCIRNPCSGHTLSSRIHDSFGIFKSISVNLFRHVKSYHLYYIMFTLCCTGFLFIFISTCCTTTDLVHPKLVNFFFCNYRISKINEDVFIPCRRLHQHHDCYCCGIERRSLMSVIMFDEYAPRKDCRTS